MASQALQPMNVTELVDAFVEKVNTSHHELESVEDVAAGLISSIPIRRTRYPTRWGCVSPDRDNVASPYIDWAYLAPVMFAAFAFAVGKRMLGGAWGGRRAVLFYGWLLGFTAANVVNRCSPGWCVTVGFPFTWYAWSDALLTFGNDGVGYFIDGIGKVVSAVLNLFTFVAVASLLMRVRVGGRSA